MASVTIEFDDEDSATLKDTVRSFARAAKELERAAGIVHSSAKRTARGDRLRERR